MRGGVTTYGYDASNRMTTITDARGLLYLTNEYDATGKVIRQTQPGGIVYQLAYTLGPGGIVTQTDVTDPRGGVERATFNDAGYPLSDTRALSTAEQRPAGQVTPACYHALSVSLPATLHPLFWDCQPEDLDPEAHAPFILERVLEYGTLAGARWALGTYGPDRVAVFLRTRGTRTLSRKTLAFWTLLLGLEDEACFEKSSLDHSRPFWNY